MTRNDLKLLAENERLWGLVEDAYASMSWSSSWLGYYQRLVKGGPAGKGVLKSLRARCRNDEAMTSAEVAKVLGVSTRSLNTWRKKDDGIPYFRLPSGHPRYRPEDVMNFYMGQK